MSTLEGTTLHPRCRMKEWRFNDANLHMDCKIKQTYQCAQYRLKIVYKTWQQKHSDKVFKKENQFFVVFPCSSTCENLSNHVSITTYCIGLILTKLWWYLFSGCGQTDRQTDGQTDGQTDRHDFGILIWKHVGTQKISTQSSKLVVSRRSLYASPEDGDA